MVYPVSHSLSNLNSLSSLNSLIQKVWGISRGAGFASAIPCGELRIESDWYELCEWNLEDGECRSWSYKITGRFETRPGDWGASAGETGSLRKKAEENVQPASAVTGAQRRTPKHGYWLYAKTDPFSSPFSIRKQLMALKEVASLLRRRL